MSDLGLDADLSLDIRDALDQAARLERAIERALTGASVVFEAEVDTSAIPGAVASAVASAPNEVIVTGQADGLAGDITSAIADADTTAAIDADTTGLGAEVAAAVAAADATIDPDTAGVGPEIAGAVAAGLASADTRLDVEATAEIDSVDAGEVTRAIDDALDAADTTVAVDADTTGLDDAASSAGLIEAAMLGAVAAGAGLDDALAPALVEAAAIAAALDRDLLERTRNAPPIDARIVYETNAEGVTQEVRGAIELGVRSADDRVIIDAEARDVTGEIDAAVNAADSTVELDADASAVTGAVGTAIERAPRSVVVTADASPVTAAVNGALTAADTDVTVIADPGPLRAAGSAADALNSSLIASTQSGLSLRTVLQLGGAGAAAAGLYALVDAASETEQAVGGTVAIFGDYSTEVSGFAQTASESAGLTEQSARQLTSQIGGLLQGFGFTQDEAAETSVVLAQLGADLAATFGGTSQEAVEALGAAIRGETDPIERFGISLNATAADAKAVELGLAASTTEVSANARAQGALALIMERSAQAQGQFGREVNTTAGQLERARAEVGNAAAEVGQNLQPAVNEVVASFRSDLLPALIDLGNNAGPALADVLLALAPVFGTTTDLVIALAPAISVLANLIGAMPPELIGAVAAFALLNRTVTPLAGRINDMGNPLRALRESLTAGNFALALGATAFSFWAAEQNKARQEAADLAADIDGFASSLDTSANAAAGYQAQLESLISTNEDLSVTVRELGDSFRFEIDPGKALAEAGVSAEDFAAAVAAGGDTLDEFINRAGAAGDEGDGLRTILRGMADTMSEGAEASIESGIALGAWTDRAAEAAIEANTASNGAVNYSAALDQLKDSQREEAVAAEEAAAAQDALASSLGGVDSEGATQAVTSLGTAVRDMRDGVGNSAIDFGRFALGADQAELSAEELDAIAASLGTTADELGPAIDRAVEPIYNLRDAAASTLPSLQDIAGNIDEFSVDSFTDNLEEAYTAVRDFRTNLAELQAENPRVAAAAAELGPAYAAALAEGLREGRPGVLDEAELYLAGLEAEGANLNDYITGDLGPELALATGELAAGMTQAFGGQLQMEPGVRESIRAIEGTVEEEKPSLLGALNIFGEQGGTAFETGFTPDAIPAIVSLGSAVAGKQAEWFAQLNIFGAQGDQGFGLGFTPDAGPGLAGAAAGVEARKAGWFSQLNIFGQRGDEGFGTGFGPNPGPALEGVNRAVSGRRRSFFDQLNIFGGQGRAGFGAGIAGMDGAAARATNAAIAAVKNSGGGAHSAGYTIGQQVAQGFNSGLGSLASSIAATGASMVSSALASMRSAARISSPSRLFAEEVGEPIAEGVAVGITEGTSTAETAGQNLITSIAQLGSDAVAGLDVSPVSTPDVTLFGAAGASQGGGGTVINMVPGAVVINPPLGDPNPELTGARAWRGFEAAAMQRDVAVTAGLR